MRKREREAFEKRTALLESAIANAVQRVEGKATPLVTKVGLFSVDIGRVDKDGPVLAVPSFIDIPLESWRVGRNPGDSYFEFKLVPQMKSLVVASPRLQGQTSAEVFFQVFPEDLAVLYTSREVKAIVKLIDAIEPLSP